MPQLGNEKPRVFKIPEYEAVIQRLGFNNKGIEEFLRNLKNFDKKKNHILGINIGKNKNSEDNFSDYEFLYKVVKAHADYITVNISSPNTPGLRDLQKKENINKLISRIPSRKKTTFIKADINDRELDDMQHCINSVKIDGLILTNTTISRQNL